MKYTDVLVEKKRLKKSEITVIEKKIDTMFDTIGIDIKFTKHFKGRIRLRQIQADELIETFTKLFKKHKSTLKKDDFDALIYNVAKYLNIPIHVDWDENEKEYDLKAITVVKTKKKPMTLHKGAKQLNV